MPHKKYAKLMKKRSNNKSNYDSKTPSHGDTGSVARTNETMTNVRGSTPSHGDSGGAGYYGSNDPNSVVREGEASVGVSGAESRSAKLKKDKETSRKRMLQMRPKGNPHY